MKRKNKTSCGHTTLNSSCINCAELLDYWNSVLIETGDGEIEDTPCVPLLEKDIPSELHLIRAEYYDQIRRALSRYKFNDPLVCRVLSLHAEGMKISEIVRSIKFLGDTIHRETVRFWIRRFEHETGIRKWSHKKMHLKPPIK